MDLVVHPGHPLRGEVRLAGDKSISHRAALFASLARGESRIENFLVSGVTRPMLAALTELGVEWHLDGATLTVQGRGLGGLSAPRGPVDCGNSATTLRLLAGAVAAAGVPAVLTGSEGLRRRPMTRIIEPLREMGVPIRALGHQGTAPLELGAREPGTKLRSAEFDLPVASAQVKTAILLAGLAADGPVTVREPGPSRNHTERMLPAMGVPIEHPATVHPPADDLAPLSTTLPGDISSAAFLLVAGSVVPGSEIVLRGIGINPTRTGLPDALRAMGAKIEVSPVETGVGEPAGDITIAASPLSGIEVAGDRVVRMIDEFPAFAVAAAFADGRSAVRDAAELRYKESDRIATICGELGKLGVETEEFEDGMAVHGGKRPAGGTVESHGDHRIALALSVAGLAASGPVTVQNAEIIGESFPEFTETLSRLGAVLS